MKTTTHIKAGATLRESTSKNERERLRSIHEHRLPTETPTILQANCNSPAHLLQFWKDLRTYGLWEALLYVEGYEDSGYFNKGTALKVLQVCNK